MTVASCAACHTPQEGGQPLDGMAFAGGMAFERPGYGTVRSANLTPHQETGLGAWTEEDFVARFAAGAGDHGAPIPPGTMNTVMPWDEYAGMREDDVRAMWAWLQTLPPVDHEVVRFTPSAAERG